MPPQAISSPIPPSVALDEKTKGLCSLCGTEGEFHRGSKNARESFRCPSCTAPVRYRLQASILLSLFSRHQSLSIKDLIVEPEFKQYSIYEPAIKTPFRRYLSKLPHHTESYFWPETPRGEKHDGVRSEDLQALTFKDQTFDIVITSDIFEHIRHPFDAFAEIYRVLRPGGCHIFTVPMSWPLSATSIARVETSTPEDKLLLPAVYDGGGGGPEGKGSLVYTDFGVDLVQYLGQLGMPTHLAPGIDNAVTFISWRAP